MPRARVIQQEDGTVAVLRAAEDVDVDTLYAGFAGYAELSYVDVDDATLPDRADRDYWRLVDGTVTVDAEAKAAAQPRTTLEEDIAAATTVAHLKAIVRRMAGL